MSGFEGLSGECGLIFPDTWARRGAETACRRPVGLKTQDSNKKLREVVPELMWFILFS